MDFKLLRLEMIFTYSLYCIQIDYTYCTVPVHIIQYLLYIQGNSSTDTVLLYLYNTVVVRVTCTISIPSTVVTLQKQNKKQLLNKNKNIIDFLSPYHYHSPSLSLTHTHSLSRSHLHSNVGEG